MTVIPVSRRRSLARMMSWIVLALLLLIVGVSTVQGFKLGPELQRVNDARQRASQQESRLWRLGYSANVLAWTMDPPERLQVQSELTTTIDEFTSGLNGLLEVVSNDPNLDEVQTDLNESYNEWLRIRDDLERVATAPTPSQAATLLASPDLERRYARIRQSIQGASSTLSRKVEDAASTATNVQTWVNIAFLALSFWALFLSRKFSNRINDLSAAAQEFTRGNHKVRAPLAGNDELTGLADAFNTMTERVEQQIESERRARLRIEEVLRALNQTAEGLAGAASEILAATSEQAAAAAEEAAAVQETSVTVEELKQVAALSSQKSGTVATLALQSEEVTLSGREAVDRTVEGMGRIRDQVQSIASSMSRLSEQTQAVGEIISTVQDLAEQSNMLAVNAAIEAARAGEHGYGFSVVANEVRSLAEQSRQATVQVRSILGEIQKAVNTALASTDAGTRSVENGMELVNRAGEVIRSLTETISHSSNAASQIRASADQHTAGVDQIAQAISAIHDASVQALESTRQTERAARVLNEMSMSLKSLLRSSEAEAEGRDAP